MKPIWAEGKGGEEAKDSQDGVKGSAGRPNNSID